jgi:hypothetical protein
MTQHHLVKKLSYNTIWNLSGLSCSVPLVYLTLYEYTFIVSLAMYANYSKLTPTDILVTLHPVPLLRAPEDQHCDLYQWVGLPPGFL